MTNDDRRVEQLMNVGPTIARRLAEIGIRTGHDLRRVGAVAAYEMICARYPGQTIPVCYYLYSLEGALRAQHWDALAPRTKESLLRRVSPNKRPTKRMERTRRGVTRVAKRKTRATLPRR
jgi:DNA transformation protein